ncbi:hypothetical protein, partial [uncultured Methanomethylovorans sp.]|uniref:hypothetical protein n=1 Tax=uncultured Methanomethylovorans sp. TaxID=183759 RepID=UPI002622F1F3
SYNSVVFLLIHSSISSADILYSATAISILFVPSLSATILYPPFLRITSANANAVLLFPSKKT